MVAPHRSWSNILQRNQRLRELAPAHGDIRSFYGPLHLFQRGAEFIVVDTLAGIARTYAAWADLLAHYPGFDDVALPVTADLDVVLAARRRGRRVADAAALVEEADGALV